MTRYLLTVIVCAPLAGAVIVLLLRPSQGLAIRAAAAASCGLGLFLSTRLWTGYDPAGVTWQFTERAEWLPSIGASFALGVDAVSILLIILTSLVGTVAMLADAGRTARLKPFYVALLTLTSSVLLMFAALDLLLFWCGAAAACLSTHAVLTVGNGGAGAAATRRFAFHAVVALGALAIAALGLSSHAHAAAGVYTFDLTQLLQLPIPPRLQTQLFVLFLVAFGVVVPLLPFVTWLPAAVGALPPAAGLVVSAALLKVGSYGLVRFVLPLLPDAARQFAPAVSALALAGVLVSVAAASRQTEWRRVVAYLAAAYMGFVVSTMFRLAPAELAASLLQQVDQGLLLAVVFLFGGYAARTRELRVGRTFVGVSVAMIALGWMSFAVTRAWPPPQAALIETSVGRVIARVVPELAPTVKQPSDCGTAKPPVELSSSAPAGWIMTAPCEDAARPAAAKPPDSR